MLPDTPEVNPLDPAETGTPPEPGPPPSPPATPGPEQDLRDQGVEPMALLSHMARLGSSLPVEVITDRAALIGSFDLGQFGMAPTRFDPDELALHSAKTLRALPFEAVAARLAGAGVPDDMAAAAVMGMEPDAAAPIVQEMQTDEEVDLLQDVAADHAEAILEHVDRADAAIARTRGLRLVGLALALLFKLLMAMGIFHPDSWWEPLFRMILVGVGINVIFALFNLIPIPPLDGSGVLAGFLSPQARARYLNCLLIRAPTGQMSMKEPQNSQFTHLRCSDEDCI